MVIRFKHSLVSIFALTVVGCSGFVIDTELSGLGQKWLYISNKNIQTTSTIINSMVYLGQVGACACEKVIYGGSDGLLYTVDAVGVIFDSTDARISHSYSADNGSINSIAAGDSRVIAVGNLGGGGSSYTIHYSDDFGESWKGALQNGTASDLNSIAFGGGRWVAVGDSGNIQVSDAGLSWIQISPAGGYSGDFSSITYAEGTFVAVGTSGEIQTSTNGVSWTSQSPAGGYTGDFTSIASGTSGASSINYFVAVGGGNEVETSTDGVTWTKQSMATGNNYLCVAYANDVFMVVNDGTSNQVEVSADPAVEWSAHSAKAATSYATCGAFVISVEAQFYFMGEAAGGVTASSDCACFWFDNLNFEIATENLEAVAVGNNIAVALGNGRISYTDISTNLYSGTTQDAGGTGAVLNDVIFNGSQFVAVGDSQQVETSPDGSTWTEVNASGVGDFKAVAYSGSLYVAVGDSASIWSSPDLLTWTSRTAAGGSTNNFTAITHGFGNFVAVGAGGEIQYSSDGITWNQASAAGGYTGQFNGIAYSGRFLMAVGQAGEIQQSETVTTWTKISPDNGFTNTFNNIGYSDGLFVAVGEGGEIQTSIFGSEFFERNADYGFEQNFRGVAVSEGYAVIVGDRGVIEISRPIE